MCGICRTVNCIRRRLFGSCGCNNNSDYSCENTYSYNGCDNDCHYSYSNYDNGCGNSRYSEPRTRITCANQRDNGFTPCCDDDDCSCNHSRNCGCGCDD